MQRVFFIGFFLMFATIIGSAQTGTISGVVIDGSSAETLIGATVLISEKPGVGGSSDIDGRYKISDLEPGTYTVVVSYVSFETKTISGVEVKNDMVTPLDITLNSGITDLQVVEVKARPRQENLNTVLAYQQKSIAPAEVVSRDIITRTPDKNTGEVLKRMSGTTITDGKFVVIRGLSDRYNLALVNGNLLPSTEPDRKTFAFDLFPSTMLDNLIVIKAAQPNLPGDFAGGIIMLNTRDIPDKPFLTLSAGAGYNTISTFKEYYTYTGGKTDWLGIDDGTRQLPGGFPTTQDAFDDLTTAERADLGKQFAPWGAYAEASSPIDQSYQLSAGWVKKTGKVGEFGAIAALTYNNSHVSTFIKRNDFDNGTDSLYAYQDDQYKNNILWGGLLNISYKLNDNNKFSLKNTYNINSSDITTMRDGVNFSRAQYVQNEYYEFNSNALFSTQIGGDHYLSGSQTKVKWTAGLNTMKRDQPNYRTVNYAKNMTPSFEGDTLFTFSPSPFASPDNLGIFYSYMDEKTYTANLDITRPFEILGAKHSIGIGGSILSKARSFDARVMGVATSNDIFFNPEYYNIVALPINELLQPENFSDSLFFIDEITNPSDAYTATQDNKAVYAMLDNVIARKLRIVWGARAEFFGQTLQSFAYGFSSTPDTVEVDTRETDSVGLKFDFLPSVNITFAASPKTNVRLSAYKTVARPELRELAPFGYYDIETNSSIVGNPSLLATNIYNADLKVEHFFGAGQVISGGVFYKKFYDPIGQRFFFGTVRELKPINDSLATVVGAEFELRKNLSFINKEAKWLEQFTFNTNLAVLNSTTILHIADTAIAGTAERDMQGQSNYVVNAGMTYIHAEKGYSCTLLFNQIGRRISEYGNAQYDDIYENPRPLVDAQISIPFNKGNGSVKLNMSDVLNRDAIFYQDVDVDGAYDASIDNTIRVYDNGAKFSLSVNYTF